MINGIPAWNFQLLINVFEDDNYWDTSLADDMPEAYEAISSIGKKYSDIAEYEEALEIYNKYEPMIIDYYGGRDAVDYIIQEFDVIPVGIIKPPKLKSKLRAKYLQGVDYKYGAYYEPMSVKEQLKLDEGRFDENGNPNAGELIPLTRALKRAIRNMTTPDNRRASQVYFNTDIISQIRDGVVEEDMDSDERLYNMSIEEHIAYWDKEHEPVEQYMTQEQMRAFVTGSKPQYSYSIQANQPITVDLMIKKAMLDAGLDPLSNEERKRLSPAELSRLATYLGADYVYDEKTRRKMLKREEKAAKNAEKERARYNANYEKHRASVDRALTDMLTARSRISRMNRKDDD